MVTVKEMLQVLEELKMKEHVWHSVKEYLEQYLPEGNQTGNLHINGVAISEATVIDVLGDVDTHCLEPIQEKIIRIEGAKVDGAGKEERKVKPERDKRDRRHKDSKDEDVKAKPSRRGRAAKIDG